jgi:hypothetical protein
MISTYFTVIGAGALGMTAMVPSVVDADLISKFAVAAIAPSIITLILHISAIKKNSRIQ